MPSSDDYPDSWKPRVDRVTEEVDPLAGAVSVFGGSWPDQNDSSYPLDWVCCTNR